MSQVGGLLHKIRDALLVAAEQLARGDEEAAAETIEKASAEVRAEIERPA